MNELTCILYLDYFTDKINDEFGISFCPSFRRSRLKVSKQRRAIGQLLSENSNKLSELGVGVVKPVTEANFTNDVGDGIVYEVGWVEWFSFSVCETVEEVP